MVTTPTSNKALSIISTGTEVGVWGAIYNTNMDILDKSLGGLMSIALTSDTILTSSQYVNVFLSFTGALGSDVSVTLPSIGSFYSVQNLTTNSSLFSVILKTSAGGEQIGVPPGPDFVDVMTDRVNVKFRNFGRIGSYADVASSAVPTWISDCTVPPYLYCNGGTFSSATYPVLTSLLGSTTLPDCRGRLRFSLDAGTNRNTLYMSGNTLSAGGGVESLTYAITNTPWRVGDALNVSVGGGSTNMDIKTKTADPVSNIPAALIQGITMIRSA